MDIYDRIRDRAFVAALIEREHFGSKKSIRKIERELGLGKTLLNGWCKRHGIEVRSQREASSLSANTMVHPSGADHWRAHKPKTSARLAEIHRKRMSGPNNPVYDREAKRKAARTRARRYRRAPTTHEARMVNFFASASPRPVFQQAVGPYILDFAFMDEVVALELDGRGHAGRVAKDAERDVWLIGRGWTIVRVDQDCLWNPRARVPKFATGKLLRVLKDLIPKLKVPGAPPSLGRKYRVLIRNEENPAGIRL